MDYKVILSGRLEFGNSRNFEQVIKLYDHRRENYYRSDVLFRTEQVFQVDNFTIDLPRFIGQATEKTWRNTVKLFQQVAEYAIAGDINLWGIREGKPTEHWLVEPSGDKTAIMAFREGRDMIQESGREEEAKAALSRAIEKFERHALAYERRGFVNFKLRNFDDAVYDYSKSIDINPNKPEPFFGRGIIYMQRQDWKKAFSDFEQAVAKSIPHQNIHWRSRAFKGDCLIQNGQLLGAIQEYQFFLKRNFSGDHPLATQVRQVAFACGKALAAENKHKEATDCFKMAMQAPLAASGVPGDDEILQHQQLAIQQTGQQDLSAPPKAGRKSPAKKA